MKGTQLSQASPMTIWCVLVLVLVTTLVTVCVALFVTPGHSNVSQEGQSPSTMRQ
jgi:hypothetical protein